MQQGWTLRSIDEIAKVERGRSRHRPRNDPSLYGGPYPFIQTTEIHISDLYIRTHLNTYSQKGLDQSRLWEPGVLCITNAGENTGDCAILGIRACFPDSIIAVTPDATKSDLYFLKYAVDQIRSQLRRVTKGATQDNLSIAKLVSFKFPVPSVLTQRRIGGILRQYGELIEVNQRRIQLLEQAAQLFFQEWFVHLRFPGHEHTSVTNGLPDGWERVPLSEIVQFVRGVEPGSRNYFTEYSDDTVPFLRVGDISKRESGIFIRKELSKGKMLIPDDIVITLDGTIGLVRIGLKGAYSSGIRRIVITDTERLGWAFTFGLLRSASIQQLIHAYAKGTTIKHASTAIKYMQCILPKPSLMKEYEKQVEPLLGLVLVLTATNESLAAARRLLVPRLMSGEVVI